MKWFLVIASLSLLAFGAGCTQTSQAFEVTSPDGTVISSGNDMLSAGISAPSLIQQPTISDTGSNALQ